MIRCKITQNCVCLQRPLMPSSMSTLSLSDQLSRHEDHLSGLRIQIEDHLRNPLPKGAKAGTAQAYKDKQEFLRFEIMRYETYILTLRTRKAPADQAATVGTAASGAAACAAAGTADAATGSRYWSDH